MPIGLGFGGNQFFTKENIVCLSKAYTACINTKCGAREAIGGRNRKDKNGRPDQTGQARAPSVSKNSPATASATFKPFSLKRIACSSISIRPIERRLSTVE